MILVIQLKRINHHCPVHSLDVGREENDAVASSGIACIAVDDEDLEYFAARWRSDVLIHAAIRCATLGSTSNRISWICARALSCFGRV